MRENYPAKKEGAQEEEGVVAKRRRSWKTNKRQEEG